MAKIFVGPRPVNPETPFYLTHPESPEQTEIIFGGLRPCNASEYNQFSARDLLRAADGTKPLWVLSEEETLEKAKALGASHEDAIAGLSLMMQTRQREDSRTSDKEYIPPVFEKALKDAAKIEKRESQIMKRFKREVAGVVVAGIGSMLVENSVFGSK